MFILPFDQCKKDNSCLVFWVIFQQKGVGLKEPLVDKEGFPRSDIDVYSVRHARHDIICKFDNISMKFLYLFTSSDTNAKLASRYIDAKLQNVSSIFTLALHSDNLNYTIISIFFSSSVYISVASRGGDYYRMGADLFNSYGFSTSVKYIYETN